LDVVAAQGFEASVPAISLTVDALWSPDIDGQICKATMLEVQTYRDVELEEERTRRTTRDAEDEEARVEALIARLKLEVEIKRDLAVQLARTKERIVAETARAERAETNLALTKVRRAGVVCVAPPCSEIVAAHCRRGASFSTSTVGTCGCEMRRRS
jgi:hypothetical protein